MPKKIKKLSLTLPMQINQNEIIKRLMLAETSFFTLSEKTLLQKKLDSFNDIAVMSNKELSSIIDRDLTRTVWDGNKVLKKAQTANFLMKKLGIGWSFFGDADYPAMLTEMKDSPYVVFYRGNLDCLKAECVSMVGTRRATATARKAAFDFARDASEEGQTVVSGLAFGIDIASHCGAMNGKSAKTVAVLPGGIDTIVPACHTKHAAQIIEKGGLILSEYTPGTPAQPFRFVQRNRIIAALSPATLVVQAPAGSGAMLTADFALDYNRDVFFHGACFNRESKALDEMNARKLSALARSGKAGERKARSKLYSSPERYVAEGAQVVNSYAEYCQLKGGKFCGNNIKKSGQMDLFVD